MYFDKEYELLMQGFHLTLIQRHKTIHGSRTILDQVSIVHYEPCAILQFSQFIYSTWIIGIPKLFPRHVFQSLTY